MNMVDSLILLITVFLLVDYISKKGGAEFRYEFISHSKSYILIVSGFTDLIQ